MNGIKAFVCSVVLVTINPTKVKSQVNGDISLNEKGSVRVYYSNELKYLPLCLQPNSTAENIANTVCRQLGFANAQRFKPVKRPVSMDKYINIESCGNDVSHIFRCIFTLHLVRTKCRLLWINCTSQHYEYEGNLKLEAEPPLLKNSTSSGILKVYLNKEWTPVCNDTFGDDEADSACRQLGYTGSIAHHSHYYEYSNDMWIGTEEDGKLSCPTSEPCLTRCFSKALKYKEKCRSNLRVYLECEFETNDAKQYSAGSKSVCIFAKEDSASGSIAGIVLGSISLAFVCIFGILVILYCCTRSERPHTSNLTTSITYDYSHIGSQGDECAKEEKEEEFNDSDASSYQPPTPLVEKQ